mmetsp:Transcript_15026/g.28190  ORF Transcript_15026/g.28190 Transcript_15026/m.28190 type:complete len:482 (-) Transcript_15026:1020-2465(-)
MVVVVDSTTTKKKQPPPLAAAAAVVHAQLLLLRPSLLLQHVDHAVLHGVDLGQRLHRHVVARQVGAAAVVGLLDQHGHPHGRSPRGRHHPQQRVLAAAAGEHVVHHQHAVFGGDVLLLQEQLAVLPERAALVEDVVRVGHHDGALLAGVHHGHLQAGGHGQRQGQAGGGHGEDLVGAPAQEPPGQLLRALLHQVHVHVGVQEGGDVDDAVRERARVPEDPLPQQLGGGGGGLVHQGGRGRAHPLGQVPHPEGLAQHLDHAGQGQAGGDEALVVAGVHDGALAEAVLEQLQLPVVVADHGLVVGGAVRVAGGAQDVDQLVAVGAQSVEPVPRVLPGAAAVRRRRHLEASSLTDTGQASCLVHHPGLEERHVLEGAAGVARRVLPVPHVDLEVHPPVAHAAVQHLEHLVGHRGRVGPGEGFPRGRVQPFQQPPLHQLLQLGAEHAHLEVAAAQRGQAVQVVVVHLLPFGARRRHPQRSHLLLG